MANLLKSFAEMLAAGQNPIANTHVADTGVLDNAPQVLKSVLDTAQNIIQPVVDNTPQTAATNNNIIVYRTLQTLFYYTDKLGKVAKDILPAGTKVVKLTENNDNITILAWFKGQHYIGNIL